LAYSEGEPDIADLAVILGVVPSCEHPIGDRPGRREASKLLAMKAEGDEVVFA
jgi:hypothetical protein